MPGSAGTGGSSRRTERAESASRLEADVLHELRSFADSFTDALKGDFLAERRLRAHHQQQPESLRLLLARNRRTLTAQKALQTLYGKLLDRAALSLEEQALAEHARDVLEAAAQREVQRRLAAGA